MRSLALSKVEKLITTITSSDIGMLTESAVTPTEGQISANSDKQYTQLPGIAVTSRHV